MTGEINLGNNYQIDEDSNGDLVIKDETGNNVLRWDNTNNEWNAESNAISNLSAVSTEQVNNTHYADTSDDLQSKLDSLGTDDELVILPGTHTITSSLTPPNNCVITLLGTIKIDGQISAFEREDSVEGATQNITIRGFGMGEIDGNKDNNTFSGTRTDHELIRFTEDTWGDSQGVAITGLEIYDNIAGAGIAFTRMEDVHIENNHIHDMGTSTTPCDGMFAAVQDSVIRDNKIQNITDTGVAGDNVQDVVIENNNIANTDSYNTNAGSMINGITVNPKDRLASAKVDGNIVNNIETPGNNAADAIEVVDQPNDAEVRIVNNHIKGDHNSGIVGTNTLNDGIISNNRLEGGSNNGIQLTDSASVASVSGNVVKNYSGNGFRAGSGTDNITYTGNTLSGNSTNWSIGKTTNEHSKFSGNDPRFTRASGTITLTGGGTGPFTSYEENVMEVPDVPLQVIMWVEPANDIDADYEYRKLQPDISWDESAGSGGTLEMRVRADWVQDPGSGNDVTVSYDVVQA